MWGSFLNVVIHRVPRDMSVIKPDSHCPACETPIPFYRNVPVLSWLWLRGRAACCGTRIPARYALVELIGGVLCLAAAEATMAALGQRVELFHAAMVFLAHSSLCLALAAAAFIDLEFMILPDRITIGGTVLGLFTPTFRGMDYTDAFLGAAIGFLLVWVVFDRGYRALRGVPGMGLGDAKLLMLAGAWFGWSGALFVLGAGAIQGSVAAVIAVVTGRGLDDPDAVKREREELRAELETLPEAEREALMAELDGDPLLELPGEGLGRARIAFGPFLILAILETLLIGRERIFAWLLSV
ncbi:MAG: prepilin peptidase [Myxococcota bacterium]